MADCGSFRMRLRFWGVRGSIPTPQPSHLAVGGNTPCVEIRLPDGRVLILDGGTGIRDLGQSLSSEPWQGGHPIHIFLTHFHWDHIQGIPFFGPLHRGKNHLKFYGPSQNLEKVLSGQMREPYFPVGLEGAAATKEFIRVEKVLEFGDLTVRPFPLNHPQGATGYRLERAGRVVVYATDLEHGHKNLDEVLREHSKDADILIYDAQYTPDEYRQHEGWGHSTWLEATRLAQECQVKRLLLFHHDPTHDDGAMDEIVLEARTQMQAVDAAREGFAIEL